MPSHAAASQQPAQPQSSTPQVSDYRKFLIHLGATVLGLLLAAYTDGRITAVEALQLAVVALGTVAVYTGGNAASGLWAYTKAICAWVVVVASAAIPYAAGGWNGLLEGIPVIAAAAAAALGVGVVPNTSSRSLAEVMRATLAEVQQMRATLTGAPASAPAPWITQATAQQPAPATSSSSAVVTTGTLEAVQARNGTSFPV
jgi:alanine dehydrogenase